jgi:CheY-like chemotaxis protein
MCHTETAGQGRARRPIVVLLVDDQPFVGMAVSRLLASEVDIEVHCCLVAGEALAHAERLAPTVILQDLVMPDIDGLTLVGRFRQNPATATTPIVVMSGNDEASVRAQALAAGADDYVVKVPDKVTLSACIRRHHVNGQNGRPAASVSPAQDNDSAADPSSGPLDGGVMAALRETGAANSGEILTGLIDLFLAEAGPLVDRLQQAGNGGPSVAAVAHSLRGTATTMGARQLGALAAEVEERAHRLPDAAIEPAAMAAIADEFVRVRAACLRERASAAGVRP